MSPSTNPDERDGGRSLGLRPPTFRRGDLRGVSIRIFRALLGVVAMANNARLGTAEARLSTVMNFGEETFQNNRAK